MKKNAFFDIVGKATDISYPEKYKHFAPREISGSITERTKRILSSRVFKLSRGFLYLLTHISTRIYGAAMLCFGVIALVFHFLGLYPTSDVSTPIIASVLSLLSVLFLLADKPLPLFLQDFVITDYMFFEFFCIKRFNKMEGEKKFPVFAALLFGAATALFGLLFPIKQVVFVIGAAVFLLVSFASPEFAFFMTFLVLPYLEFFERPSLWFSALILVCAASFIRKVIFGKRVITLERYDLLFALFIFAILISGIFVKGTESFTRSVEMLVMTAGYLLASNIITNRRIALRTMNSIVISAIPPAVYSVFRFVLSVSSGGGIRLAAGIKSTFATTDAYALFLVLAVVFSAAMIWHTHGALKLFYIAAAVLDLFALILAGELFALFALWFGTVAFAVVKTNRCTVSVLCVLVVLPYAAIFLLGPLLDVLFSMSSSVGSYAELVSLWRTSLDAFFDNAIFGIGMGKECFAEEMLHYGVTSFNNSSNLFIEIGLEAGIFALVIFLLMLVVRLGHRARYYPYVKHSDVSVISPISAVCIICFIVYGSISYIFANLSSYYLFCVIFGVGSATLRVAKKEYDDRIHYYEDTRASHSSVIDIEIRG